MRITRRLTGDSNFILLRTNTSGRTDNQNTDKIEKLTMTPSQVKKALPSRFESPVSSIGSIEKWSRREAQTRLQE